ncbi:hypothetical protein ACH2G3_25380 [Bacillus cereus]|uniref:hypothetical protein n=1 Tax=Bacillus cereus group sp. MYBK185-1 TaxID=3450672 RepID=UPI00379A284C
MKLSKIITTLVFSILVLSACSSLTKEEYIDAVAKERNESGGELKKVDDTSLSVNERKKYIEKVISLNKDAKKLSVPSELKSAHKEYVKSLDLEIEKLEKTKENLSGNTSLFDEYNEEELERLQKYNENFEEKLGDDLRKKLHEKNRDYRRVSKNEYMLIVANEMDAFFDCFKDENLFSKDRKDMQELMNKARKHLDKVAMAIPPKELEEEEKVFRKSYEKLYDATDKLYFDPELKESETLKEFSDLYQEGVKLHNEFTARLLKK